MPTEESFNGTYSIRVNGSEPGDNLVEFNVPNVDGAPNPVVTEAQHDSFAIATADFAAGYFNLGPVHVSKVSTTTTTVSDPNFYVTS